MIEMFESYLSPLKHNSDGFRYLVGTFVFDVAFGWIVSEADPRILSHIGAYHVFDANTVSSVMVPKKNRVGFWYDRRYASFPNCDGVSIASPLSVFGRNRP